MSIVRRPADVSESAAPSRVSVLHVEFAGAGLIRPVEATAAGLMDLAPASPVTLKRSAEAHAGGPVRIVYPAASAQPTANGGVA